ncbi:MAG: hypothetical protein OSB58_01080 [Alphaproteobacteria bacterium]|nr:hypothetical protein [Alphaproteobacteria bacterium]
MKLSCTILLVAYGVLAFNPTLVLAASSHQPYSGQQSRDIKALSQEQIDGYLNVSGMGFAKSAELNH